MNTLLRKMLLWTPFLIGSVLLAQNGPKIKHVLVISIDGMHSQDLTKWVQANPSSALARLQSTGIVYPNAFTTQPSDSIPATVGIFTGASPSLAGMYYDDAYHRGWSPKGSTCTTVGTVIDLKEGIDLNPHALDGGGGIDPAQLPRNPANGCLPVYPHNMLRVNTVFEVVRAAGMYTAYSEKRPSYDFLNGPSGKGVQDLYTPEIAFDNPAANDTLKNVTKTIAFDQLRVNSVLNEINELNHDATAEAPKPALFGMNFQAVNSAKKSSPTSGYADALGNPDATLQTALAYVDSSLNSILSAMRDQGLTNKTVIIITAKHGESPVMNHRDIVLTSVIGNLLTAASISTKKITQKTSGLVWLSNQAQTAAAVAALNNNSAFGGHLKKVLSHADPEWPFPDPLVDKAVPDIVVVMNDGTNFEPSVTSTTYAEHGGFGENETHVPLLVSYSRWSPATQMAPVSTRQIAPTILAALGLDPSALISVQVEHVAPLADVVARLH